MYVDWFSKNNLTVNVNKTEILYINHQKGNDTLSINIHGSTISSSNQVRTLGLYKESSLKWTTHITNTIKSCNFSLWKMRSFYHLLSNTHLRILIESLVLSKLYYMIAIWGDCEKIWMKKVCKVFNSAKKVAKLNDAEEQIWLDPENKFKFDSAVLAFQSFHKVSPTFLHDKIRLDQIGEKRTRFATHVFIKNNSHLTYLEQFLTNAWINIPEELKKCINAKIFKKKYKMYLLNEQKEYYIQRLSSSFDYSCIFDAVIAKYTD